MMRFPVAFALASLLISACGDDGDGPADAGSTDAGVASDAGAQDAQAPQDAGTADAGTLASCDWVDQDCPDPNDKCRIEYENLTSTSTTSCVPAGDKGFLESCTRVSEEVGNDDCAEGLFCSLVGLSPSTPQMRHCLKTCDANSTCDPGYACQSFNPAANIEGHCVPTCDPFGTDCPTGAHCTANLNDQSDYDGFFACTFDGPSDKGQSCEGNLSCAPPYGCITLNANDPLVCRQYCDINNPCVAPEQCVLFPVDGVRDYGVCY